MGANASRRSVHRRGRSSRRLDRRTETRRVRPTSTTLQARRLRCMRRRTSGIGESPAPSPDLRTELFCRRKLAEAADALTIDVLSPPRSGRRLLVIDLDYCILDTGLWKEGSNFNASRAFPFSRFSRAVELTFRRLRSTLPPRDAGDSLGVLRHCLLVADELEVVGAEACRARGTSSSRFLLPPPIRVEC